MCRYVDGLLKGWEWDQLKQVSINSENAPNRSNEDKTQIESKRIVSSELNFEIFHKAKNTLFSESSKAKLGNQMEIFSYTLVPICMTLALFFIIKRELFSGTKSLFY